MWHIDDIEEDNWDVNKDQNVFHQIKGTFSPVLHGLGAGAVEVGYAVFKLEM